MQDLSKRSLTWRDYLVVASLLFGLFFGAGNLIFPLHSGQLAGANWGPAALGFLVTGVLLPLFSVLAVAITRANGVYDIGRPLGTAFALTFMVLIHATIGPLFGTPRTATVSFTVGVAPFLPNGVQHWALFGFSALFFAAAFAFSYRENDIFRGDCRYRSSLNGPTQCISGVTRSCQVRCSRRRSHRRNLPPANPNGCYVPGTFQSFCRWWGCLQPVSECICWCFWSGCSGLSNPRHLFNDCCWFGGRLCPGLP